jgi:hypothetical protein
MTALTTQTPYEYINAWLMANTSLTELGFDIRALTSEDCGKIFNLLRTRQMKDRHTGMIDDQKQRRLVSLLFALGHRLPWHQHNVFNYLANTWQRRLAEYGEAEMVRQCLSELTFETR